MSTESTEKRTPLYDVHVAKGAKMVPFAGYSMPVRYTSDKAEHMAVRQGCGLFDVSHMGEVFLRGHDVLAAADRLFSNDIRRIAPGQAMYTGLLNQDGGFVDDCIVYRFDDDEARSGGPQQLLVCVNASNREKDFNHIRQVCEAEFGGQCVATDESDDWAQIAVQGPHALDVVAGLLGEDLRTIGFFRFKQLDLQVAGHTAKDSIVARTGYTGEDGFELYVPADVGAVLFAALCDFTSASVPLVVPCGLGARDTLRLEAGLSLYGNDIDDTVTPLEAGLNFIVKLNDADKNPRNFIGADALRRQKADGIPRKLMGLTVTGRGIPRAGYPVQTTDGTVAGHVTSGTQAPHLGKAIAIALLRTDAVQLGDQVNVIVRDKPVAADVHALPHYKRS